MFSDDDYNVIPYTVFCTALEQAMAYDVDVINMSIAEVYDDTEEKQTLISTLNDAIAKGIVLVSAADNDQKEVSEILPATFENGITVSATNKQNEPDTSYSNFGDCVDVSAPGTDVYSTVPRVVSKNEENNEDIDLQQSLYFRMTGTSMAAPLVSAAAALIKSIDPDITPAEVERIIKETAYVPEDWEENCGDKNYGTGIVNFYNIAKAMLGEGESTTPTIKIDTNNKFEITAPEGTDSKIYYTLDGTVPTIENHLNYTEPLVLINTYAEKITAVCHENGKLIGEPVTYDMITYETENIFLRHSKNLTLTDCSKDLFWSSYNPDTVSVDNKGNITANSIGTTKIICRLQTGERVIWNVKVRYSPIQAFLVLFFFGFLWI